MKTIIKMIKSRSPEIPNGSLGYSFRDVTEPGLSMAFFGEYLIFVYPDEIKLILKIGV